MAVARLYNFKNPDTLQSIMSMSTAWYVVRNREKSFSLIGEYSLYFSAPLWDIPWLTCHQLWQYILLSTSISWPACLITVVTASLQHTSVQRWISAWLLQQLYYFEAVWCTFWNSASARQLHSCMATALCECLRAPELPCHAVNSCFLMLLPAFSADGIEHSSFVRLVATSELWIVDVWYWDAGNCC